MTFLVKLKKKYLGGLTFCFVKVKIGSYVKAEKLKISISSFIFKAI